jgi:putative ABC transport system ATP-binding protein
VSPLIRATQVRKSFGTGALETPVLHDVSLELRPGELVLLMGPSGSGKTTLVSILAGLLRPSAGNVELCGHMVSQLGEDAVTRVRRHSVGFVFQTYNLFPALTALDNVAEVLAMKGMPREEAQHRARSALERVGLAGRLHHKPGELSGGQKQRVAIARAIAGSPSVIIGDEVTAALDGTTAGEVMDILRAHVGQGTSALIVTHDHRLERWADRVLEISDGRMVCDRRGAC